MAVDALCAELDSLAERFAGRVGYCVLELATGQSISRRGDELFPSASTIKTALMVEAVKQIEEGRLAWEDKLDVPPPGERNLSLWAYFLQPGLRLNVEVAVHLMMSVSDNTTTVMLGDRLGILEVERRLIGLGLDQTKYTVKPPADAPHLVELRRRFQNMGVTTPTEMARLLAMLFRRELASPAASERMLRLMTRQYWDDFFESAVPLEVVVAGKNGALNQSRSATAIVFGPNPYVLTAYTAEQEDQRWVPDNAGNRLLRAIGSAVWNRLNPGWPYHPTDGFDAWGPTGGGLELD